MSRKIDDNLLLAMIQEGKEQKEVATYFNCSPAAICKRLKRLSRPSPEDVLDKYSLTDKQKAFCIEKAKGRTNTQAALAAYETSSMESAKVIGSQVMAKPEVRLAMDELMEHVGMGRGYRIRRLKSHVDNQDPIVSLKALDLSWKLDGSYAPDKHMVLDLGDLIQTGKSLDEEQADIMAELMALGADAEADGGN